MDENKGGQHGTQGSGGEGWDRAGFRRQVENVPQERIREAVRDTLEVATGKGMTPEDCINIAREPAREHQR